MQVIRYIRDDSIYDFSKTLIKPFFIIGLLSGGMLSRRQCVPDCSDNIVPGWKHIKRCYPNNGSFGADIASSATIAALPSSFIQ